MLAFSPEARAVAETTAERIRELEAAIADQSRTIDEQSQQLDEQRRMLDRQRQLLERQQRELEALLSQVQVEPESEAPRKRAAPLPPVAQAPPPQPVPPQPKAPTPRPPRPVQPAPEPAVVPEPEPAAAQPPATATPEETAEEATDARTEASAEAERPDSKRPLEQLLVETGSILLPAGTLQMQPGFEYTHLSDSAVAIAGFQIFDAILIGTISVDRLDRDIFTLPLTARYGLFDRFQLEARVPFLLREETEVIGVGSPTQYERSIDNQNIGDIDVSALWQAYLGRGWKPSVILSLRTRFPTGEDPFEIPQVSFSDPDDEFGRTLIRLKRPPTGSGFWGLTPGFNSVWRMDPAVLFFGGGYTVNFKRDVGGEFGDIDPGDQVEFFMGMNVSLSERIAMNLSSVYTYTWNAKQNGHTTPGSSFNDARLVLGSSLGLTPRTAIVVAASAGLTNQSPDYQVTIRVPFTWRLPSLFGRASVE